MFISYSIKICRTESPLHPIAVSAFFREELLYGESNEKRKEKIIATRRRRWCDTTEKNYTLFLSIIIWEEKQSNFYNTYCHRFSSTIALAISQFFF